MSGIDLSYTEPQLDIFFGSDDFKYVNVTKGRRFGATKGGANAFIEFAIEGQKLLWGDTINSNIDRYFERYMRPELRRHGVPYRWSSQRKELGIFDGWIDFRSADKPYNWEGFGYDKIFLNEAGIILKNKSLYTETVLPMLLDNPNSQLIAAGVPKGKNLKTGEEHPFYQLYKRAIDKTPGHRQLSFSSYDNPLLGKADIKALEVEMSGMSPELVEQEIYGKFVDKGVARPFAFNFDEKKHVSERAIYQPELSVKVSVDFNYEPFTAILGHVWYDTKGPHSHIFSEISVADASIEEMATRIKTLVPNIYSLEVTGDATGKNRRIRRKETDNNALFTDLRDELGIAEQQLTINTNPFHKESRQNYNKMLAKFPDFAMHPRCQHTILDHKIVQVDMYGEIIKKDRKDESQKADFIDNCRYWENTYLSDWRRSL